MMWRNHPGILAIALALCSLAALSSPAHAGVVTFGAGEDQISSVGVLDITENSHGDLFFATDNGLSWYDGEWHIVHRNFGDREAGLLSDHVLAAEFDGAGTLWLGFPTGLQRLQGGSWDTIEDQQLLKSLEIHALLRRGDEMWLAAGNAGLHRYAGGAWQWFQPGGPEGQGCSYITDLATDPSRGTLYVACREGIWSTEDTGDIVRFSRLPMPRYLPDPVRGIQTDPFGGIYVWNASAVLHFIPPGTWRLSLTSAKLLPGVDITDLQVGSDQVLWVATNNGIYAWRDGGVRQHLDASSGIGNNAVKRLHLDSRQRLWFVTPENVGYVNVGELVAAGPVIPVVTYELPEKTPVTVTSMVPTMTPGISIASTPEEAPAPADPLRGLLDGILGFFRKIFGG